MSTRSWFDALKTRFLRTLNRHERRASGRRQLAARGLKVESLEDRRVLAFVVPSETYPAGDSPQAVVSSDFNGDGFLDIAAANYSSSNVSVLLGNGSGGFGATTNFDTGTSPRSLAVGDVTGDGKIDLVTANAGGDVSILRGDGAGSFAPPDSFALPDAYVPQYGGNLAQSPYSVATGDFNGDGNLDLTVTGVTSFQQKYYYYGYSYYYQVDNAHVNVLLSDGSGGFQSAVTTPVYGLYPDSIAVGQFNADGNDDLVIANQYYGLVSVHLSDGSGGFSSSIDYYAGYYPISVAAGDVNGDSLNDLVTANNYGTVGVLLGTGSGTFGSASTYAAGTQPLSVAMADFNGDSHMDLVVANGDNASVSVLLGTGAGTGAGAFKLPVTAAVGSTPVGMAVGDFNGTGGPDLASANNGSDNVSVLLNNGIWPALNAPSITLSNGSVAEGQTGTTTEMEFNVTLSAAPTQTVTVRYATADYSALAGNDYVAEENTLTFNPGDPLTKKISVTIIGDREGENGEFFYLRLSDATNAFLDRATGVGNIIDDEPRASISGAANVLEGNTGETNKTMTFTITLSNASLDTVYVNYATADYGSATAGSDYVAIAAGTATFSPGDLTEDITVEIIGDRLHEYGEYLYVNLTGATHASLAYPTQGYGTIVDNEPRLSINSPSITEGNSGTKVLTFTVTLFAAYDQDVTVNYATQNGSATDSSDYVAIAPGTLTFSPNGPLTQTITVTIKGDKQKENDEYFSVVLSDASSNATITNAFGTGTILSDDPGNGSPPGKGHGKP